jgi:bifunctional N-acetylglucosamine-1-phosphate-uridyltransferase/glucosamine-1-phosphate-acetyltransferase GlmU-like protein
MEQAESEPEEPRKIKKTKRENINEFNKKNDFLNHETDENTTRLSDSPYREKYDKTTSNDEDDDLIEIADYCIVVNEKGLVVFDKDSDINNDVIIKSKALFRSGNEVHGTIKCYKDLELEDNVIIYGNLISEKNIKIGANCKIYGSVFSQGSVEIKENSVIGIAGKDKSVIGKHGIILNRNVRIHGYLLTEGEGKTV